jgi:mRNA interferase YafQ
MYIIFESKNFKKSYQKLRRSGKFSRQDAETVIEKLAKGIVLDQKYHNHKLEGEYTGCWECHIKPDVLLIYMIEKEKLILILIDIGSHSELFA